MRNYFRLMTVLLFTLTLASCTDESEDQKVPQTVEELKAFEQADFEEYKKEHGTPVIQYATLDELNAAYVDNGLDPLTEENFTSEEWQMLHSDELLSQARCGSTTAAGYHGDWNRNGFFSVSDLVLARRFLTFQSGSSFHWISHNNPLSIWIPIGRYAGFDDRYNPTGGDPFTLNGADILASERVLLGIFPCN